VSPVRLLDAAFPGAHGVHELEPKASAYDPAGQFRHAPGDVAAGRWEYVPGAQ
jgi:hypothetical protein